MSFSWRDELMSFLDLLKSAPSSPQAKINTVLASFNPKGSTINLFLEGRDDPSLISSNVRRIAAGKDIFISTIILGKKKDVLHAWKYFNQRFPSNSRLLFFVDKDHDDLLKCPAGTETDQNLFVTKHYSIENYLVSEEAVESFLVEICNIDSTSTAPTLICQEFKRFQESYRLIFLPWMAWIVAARRNGEMPESGNVPFSIFDVNEELSPALNWEPDMFTYLMNKCNVKQDVDALLLKQTMVELEALDTKSWLRGKQEMWCLIAFMAAIEQKIKNSDEVKNIKIRPQINAKNSIEILAPRLPCPDDLRLFLEAHLVPLSSEMTK
jgi:hypothetical protein